jgi:hypothetical protein
MKTTLKLKINMSREYLGLFIYPQKPSAGLPNLIMLSLKDKSFCGGKESQNDLESF